MEAELEFLQEAIIDAEQQAAPYSHRVVPALAVLLEHAREGELAEPCLVGVAMLAESIGCHLAQSGAPGAGAWEKVATLAVEIVA